MKRNITSVIAAVLVGSMIISSTVFAADSSTTSNTDSSTVVKSPEVTSPVDTQAAKEGRTMYAVPNGKKVGTATVGNTRVTVDYNECTVPDAIETAVPAPENLEATKVLEEYVAPKLNGKKIVCKTKLRLYKAGVSINDGFGTLEESIGVGNAYDGQIAEVYQIHQDGTITVISVPVVNGKVTFKVTDLGTFIVVI